MRSIYSVGLMIRPSRYINYNLTTLIINDINNICCICIILVLHIARLWYLDIYIYISLSLYVYISLYRCGMSLPFNASKQFQVTYIYIYISIYFYYNLMYNIYPGNVGSVRSLLVCEPYLYAVDSAFLYVSNKLEKAERMQAYSNHIILLLLFYYYYYYYE